MGNANQQQQGGGSGGGGFQVDLSSVVNALNAIISLLIGVFSLGGSRGQTDYFASVTNANAITLYSAGYFIKKGYIQNLSTTDEITVVFTANSNGKAQPNVAAGKGTVLKHDSSGAGASMPIGNVDLGDMNVISSTNPNQAVSVYYER